MYISKIMEKQKDLKTPNWKVDIYIYIYMLQFVNTCIDNCTLLKAGG